MIELTQGEMIQILRKRAGINQGQLGAEAFDTTVDSGRTKIKNIELDKQKPTVEDLKAIADVLQLPLPDLLIYPENDPGYTAGKKPDGIVVHHRIFGRFPGLEECLSILNKALILKDEELIVYIAKKTAEIFAQEPKAAANQ